MRFLSLITLGSAFLLLLSAGPIVAQSLPGQGVERPNPAAPPETGQFSFLIGTWNCTTQRMQPDGTYRDGPAATWTAVYILDGYAIQDVWVSTSPDGTRFYGTNIRSFDPAKRRWDNRWLAAGSQQWKYYEAERVGETMVMIGGEGTDARGDFVDRNTFSNIKSDSWSWRKDRSYDAGETWIEGVMRIEARRR